MITLQLAMIAMMAGSNLMPMDTQLINTPAEFPTAQIQVINTIANEISSVESVETVNAPIQHSAKVRYIAKNETPNTINQDKTYEEAMNEAFERVYAEVNKLLDQIPEKCDDQVQLRRLM